MKIDYTYWTEEDGTILGYLNEYPDTCLTCTRNSLEILSLGFEKSDNLKLREAG